MYWFVLRSDRYAKSSNTAMIQFNTSSIKLDLTGLERTTVQNSLDKMKFFVYLFLVQHFIAVFHPPSDIPISYTFCKGFLCTDSSSTHIHVQTTGMSK